MNNSIYIILLHYGNVKITDECIYTVERLNYKKPNLNLLVVDNASPNSFEKSKFSKKIAWIRSNQNLGFAGGMNFGIRKVFDKADYFILLNNDTKLGKFTIEFLLRASKENPCSIISPMILSEIGDKPIEYGGELNQFTMYFKPLKKIPRDETRVTYLSGACLFIPKLVIEKIGFLDESFFMYSEDMDYCIRAIKNRIPLIIEPKAKIKHKMGATSGGVSPFTIYYIHRNRVLLAYKHLNDVVRIFFFIYYFLLILLKMIKWRFKNPLLVKWFWLGMKDGFQKKMGRNMLK